MKRTIAIDTNVILTYRLQREPHFMKVRQLFEDCLAGKLNLFIPMPVYLEVEWVLRSYYKLPKEDLIVFFEDILLTDHLIIDKRSDFMVALSLYRLSTRVSFDDCLILKQVHDKKYEFLTLDSDLDKLNRTVFPQS